MPPVRILYLIERMAAGGSEKQLAALISGFNGSPMVRTFLCTLRPSDHGHASLPLPDISLDINRIRDPRTLRQMIRLARFCRRRRINIVQSFFQDPTLIGAMLKTIHPTKLVVSFRDLGFWRNPVENIKMRLAYRMADGFLCNSSAVRDHFAETDKIDAKRITVIPNGVEPRNVALAPPGPMGATQVATVGIVGNFNRPVKRMGDFIEAAALIKESVSKVRFVIVGDGHQRQALVRRCHELGIGDEVTFTGRVEDPIRFVRKFAVGVNTSESEGFSNAVLEYMACGLPVVVTDVGGNREMVSEGVHGFRVPVADPTTLARRVVQLLRDSELRRRMGAWNIKTVSRKYSMGAMVNAHVSFYEMMVAP